MGIHWSAMLVKVPTRMRPMWRPCISFTVYFNWAQSALMERRMGRSCCPAELIVIPERLRRSSSMSHSLSKSAIIRLTADWVYPIWSAARLMLPSSMAFSSASHFCRFMESLHSEMAGRAGRSIPNLNR